MIIIGGEEFEDYGSLPHVTLAYAASLDGSIAIAPGIRTAVGERSRATTHYLRSRHDAILIGVGTVLADNPSLDCRLEGLTGMTRQPRPVVLDLN